jgi:hypothetical protein
LFKQVGYGVRPLVWCFDYLEPSSSWVNHREADERSSVFVLRWVVLLAEGVRADKIYTTGSPWYDLGFWFGWQVSVFLVGRFAKFAG